MENNNNKFKTIGTVGKVFTILAKIVVIGGIVGVLLASITLIALPDNAFTIEADNAVTVNVDTSVYNNSIVSDMFLLDDKINKEIQDSNGENVSFVLTNDGAKMTADTMVMKSVSNRDLGVLILPTLVNLGLILAALIFAKKIFIAIKDSSTPFVESIPKNLKIIGFIMLAWSVIPSFISGIVFSIYSLTSSIHIESATIGMDFSMLNVVIALFFIALAYIFDYGYKLQQQSDETV